MKPVSFQGDLSALALSDVIQNLANNHKSGTLTVARDGVLRYIQFRGGKLASYTDNQGFSIAQWLSDKGVVSEGKIQEALRRYRKTKKKSLGLILNDMRALTLQDYAGYLQDLVLETLYEVLSFREGTFEFHEDDLAEERSDREVRALGLEIPTQNVIMEAARRMDDWQAIRRNIPAESEIYHAPRADRRRLIAETEDEATREALQLMDGTRTVRQVIAQLPYSRFDACRAVAGLIADKKVRLLESAEVLRQGLKNGDPQQEIACLEAVLEREPGHHEVIARLADLHEKVGSRDESATCRKRLAIASHEAGDLVAAAGHLRDALRLNPKDITAWQRLWDVVRQQGEPEKIAAFGRECATHFKRLGLSEIARDQLLELVKLFPGSLEFKLELADVQFALGDQKSCLQGLFELARDLLQARRFREAEAVFARILRYDRSNAKAKEYYE
jgi:tetratricopeptide (TPR) repeat protein